MLDETSLMLHWLAHLIGWNYGSYQSYNVGDRWFICFECVGCGRRSAETDITALMDFDWDLTQGT